MNAHVNIWVLFVIPNGGLFLPLKVSLYYTLIILFRVLCHKKSDFGSRSLSPGGSLEVNSRVVQADEIFFCSLEGV